MNSSKVKVLLVLVIFGVIIGVLALAPRHRDSSTENVPHQKTETTSPPDAENPDPSSPGTHPSQTTPAVQADKHETFEHEHFGSVTALDSSTHIDPQTGLTIQRKLLQTSFKHPLIIEEKTTIPDPRGHGSITRVQQMVADHILVKLKPGMTKQDLDLLCQKHKTEIRRSLLAPNTYLVSFEAENITALAHALDTFTAEAATVAYAEPDYIVHAIQTIPDDTSFSSLYGLHNTGQSGGTADADIDAPEAWDITTGSTSILVGIIDTGIDYNHNDLAANIWSNPGETGLDGEGHDKRTNGIDDDNNGFVDDYHGWDFCNNDNDPIDDHSHGTHCAGTIGGVGNNSLGVAGVCWNVSLVGIKFLSSGGGGTTADAIDAVYYATRIGVRLTSNSWGGGGFSQGLMDAISDAGNSNILFIAAAGNSGSNNDSSPHYPSSYTNATLIAVAATDHNDAKAGFSCYGLESVDLGAPGVNTYSTVPGNGYGTKSGTSMATPHVSGAAALCWSMNPSATAQEIKDAILTSVDANASLSGKTVTGGRLNVHQAVLEMGLAIESSQPAQDEILYTLCTNFIVNLSAEYAPGSVSSADLTVNATPADTAVLTDADTIAFQFNTSPITTQGIQTVNIAGDSILREHDGDGNDPWTMSFRYDALPMEPMALSPDPDFIMLLPLTNISIALNEAFDTNSIDLSKFIISAGYITGYTISAGNILNLQFDGVLSEGVFSFHMMSGAIADLYGNPNLTFSSLYTTDVTQVSFPTPLNGLRPKGSLVYEQTTAARVQTATDTDRFTINLDDQQQLSVLVTPDSTLQPVIELLDAAGHTNAVASAEVPGQSAVLQCSPIDEAGTYCISVGSASATDGSYTLQILLNAWFEEETCLAHTNNTKVTAEVITNAFQSMPERFDRASVLGQLPHSGASGEDWYAFTSSSNDIVSLYVFSLVNSNLSLELHDAQGLVASGIHDHHNVTASIDSQALPTNGTFYVRVEGHGPYTFSVIRNATFDLESNDQLAEAQDLSSRGIALGSITPPDPAPSLYYSFNDDEGSTVTDLSGNGYNGTVHSATHTTNGYLSGAYRFDGTGYIDVGDVFDVSGMASQLTVCTWVKTTGSSYFDYLIAKQQEPSPYTGWALIFSQHNLFIPQIIATHPELATAEGTHNYCDDQWHHLCAVFESHPDKLKTTSYVDGELEAVSENAGSHGSTDTSSPLTLGMRAPGSSLDYIGLLDEVAIYEKVLTADEIRYLSTAPLFSGTDYFRYYAEAGQTLSIRTFTPQDGTHAITNALDPMIELFDPSDAPVAQDDNSAPDGRNAEITHIASSTGYYSLRITAAAGRGEYILSFNATPLFLSAPTDATEGDGTLTNVAVISTHVAPTSNLVVSVQSTDPSEITVPTTVTIPAGSTSATFSITVVDDSQLDGSQQSTIRVAAPGYLDASALITVYDNESATLSVNVPASATEGEGVLTTQGVLTVSQAVATNIPVSLHSSDSSECTVPSQVFLLPGQTSAVFDLTIIDDSEIDSLQTVTITASVSNWTDGADSMQILDNENTNIAVLLPSTAVEGSGTLPGAGTIQLDGSLQSNCLISLQSDDTSEVTVPASVVLTAGQSSVQFDLTIVDDTDADGIQIVTIEASGYALAPGSNSVDIIDNDPHSLSWADIPSPQLCERAFPATITALTIDGYPASAFNDPAGLSALGAGGAITISPTTTTAFSSGIWSGTLTIETADTNIEIMADDHNGHFGLSNPFETQNLVSEFAPMTNALPGLNNASMAWGDYDNDGDLDLLLSGNGPTSALSRVYRNETIQGFPPNTNGLALYYSFDTDNGTVVLDESGHGHTGTVVDASYTNAGYSGGAFSFDGNSYINVGDVLDAVGSVTQLTVCAWIKAPSSSAFNYFIAKQQEPSPYTGWAMILAQNDNFLPQIIADHPKLATATGSDNVCDDQWHFVCAVFESWTNYLRTTSYVDGEYEAVGIYNGPHDTTDTTSPLTIGTRAPGSDLGYAGLIDEIRIFTRKLSTNEIQAIYNSAQSIQIQTPPQILDDIVFTDINAGLPDLHSGSTDWGDYDNDGDLDVLLTGLSATGKTTLVYRNDNELFLPVALNNIPGITHGTALWGDADADGKLDIILTGHAATSHLSRIYRNNGSSFSELPTTLPGLSYSTAAWGDYDNDGYPDLLLSGHTGESDLTRIYRNDHGQFIDIEVVLPNLHDAAAAWGDADADGDLDLLLCGYDAGGATSTVYRNDGSNTFTAVAVTLHGAGAGSAAWGDADNDGDYDILIAGDCNGLPLIKLYENEGSFSFTDMGAFPLGLSNGMACWADMDLDGDLDIGAVGSMDGSPITMIFTNNCAISNTPPTAPTNLTTDITNQLVSLSWFPGHDAETASNALSYNVWIGTESNVASLASPMANLTTGTRLVPANGNADLALACTMGPFPAGIHYWGVQSIDAAYQGSPFSTTATFSVPDSLTLWMPSTVNESDGVLTQCLVSLTLAVSNDTVVSFESDQTNEVSVSPHVTIPAGQTSAGFSLTVIDDSLQDGTKTVAISATATGILDGCETLSVVDNDLDHFEWNSFSLIQTSGVPFAASLTAKTIDDVTIVDYVGAANISATGYSGSITMVPTQTTGFAGGTWSEMLTISSIDSNIIITADDGSSHLGISAPMRTLGANIHIQPSALSNAVAVGTTSNRILEISNTGNLDLSYSITAFSTNPVTDNLALHYTFNTDNGGIVLDQSGNGLTGTVVDAVYTNGISGGAYYFDGNASIQVGDVLDVSGSTTQITVCAWIKTAGSSGFDYVISKQQDPAPYTGWALIFTHENLFIPQIIADYPQRATAEGTHNYCDDQWHHFCAVFEAVPGRLQSTSFVDGQFEAVGVYNSSHGDTDTSSFLTLGARTPTSDLTYEGLLDDVRIYTRALTTNEILSLYQGMNANGAVTWLSASPTEGTVSPNTTSNIVVAFDASPFNPSPNHINAQLQVRCNDAASSTNFVPVVMTVLGADLVISSIEVTNTLMLNGEAALSYSLLNQGQAPASASTVSFYLSTNTILDDDDYLFEYQDPAPPLDVGQSSTNSVTLTMPSVGYWPWGNSYIIAAADHANVVKEGDAELNNTRASTNISINPPPTVGLHIHPASGSNNPTVSLGLPVQFIATAQYEYGATNNVTEESAWFSSDSNIVAMSPVTKGLAWTDARGTAMVYAVHDGITSTQQIVTVSAPIVTNFTVIPATSPDMHVGSQQELDAVEQYSDGSNLEVTPTQWIRSETNIASINSNGILSAQSAGTLSVCAVYNAITSEWLTIEIRAQISGSVSGNGLPITDWTVQYSGPTSGVINSEGSSTFETPWLPAGTYNLLVSHSNYFAAAAQPFELGTNHTDVDLALVSANMTLTPPAITNVIMPAGHLTNRILIIHNSGGTNLAYTLSYTGTYTAATASSNEMYGAWDMTWAGPSRDRGNVFYVTNTVLLTSMEMYLDGDSNAPLQFFVYEGTNLSGTFQRLVNEHQTTASPAPTWHSSARSSVLLHEGRYYYIGCAWEPEITYGRGQSSPVNTCFGTLESGIASTTAGYPTESNITISVSSGAIAPYRQRLTVVYPTGSSAIWTWPMSGTIPARTNVLASIVFDARDMLYGQAVQQALEISSNDPLSPSNTIPLAMQTGLHKPGLHPEPAYTFGSSNTIAWISVLEAQTYWSEYSLNTGFSPAVNAGWIADTSVLFTNLADETLYYYRTRAAVSSVLGQAQSEWSDWTSSRQISPSGDSDGDGMQNDWEDSYGLNPLSDTDGDGDMDRDGLSNRSEYGADTNPTNADSQLSLECSFISSTNAILEWCGGINATQYLECSDNLLSSEWYIVYTNTPPTAISNALELNSLDRFRVYRIKAER